MDTTAFPPLTAETRVVPGIRLPWQRVERYGPTPVGPGSTRMTDRPAKGTVIESGEVFIAMSTLEELAEQDRWASQSGDAFLLDHHAGLALEAAGLAQQETRGGYHRTDRLRAFVDHYYNTHGSADAALSEPTETYQVWARTLSTGETTQWVGNSGYGMAQEMAEAKAAEWNRQQEFVDRYEDGPTKEWFVVKATTVYEECRS